MTVTEETDQEAVAHLFADEGLLAIPVVDAEGKMKGVVTADDVVGVVQEEATEDIQKIGGSEALDEPYLQIGFSDMVRKRGRWLAVLFIGEMFTATAMGFFEKEIARAVILALFVPLIISSGGNSGSQAATLVIRAMALSEVRLRDWWRVARREILTGLVLGLLLGLIGLIRILVWQAVGRRVRGALSPGGAHGGGQPARRRDVRDPRRIHAALRAPALRGRPRERLGAVRRHAGGRDRVDHLLHGGAPDPGGDAALRSPWRSRLWQESWVAFRLLVR